MLRLWRVKLLDPISVEPYYAPVPQVDRGLSGHLGAGVPLQVKEVPRTFSNTQGEGQRTCTFYPLQFPMSLSNLYCTKYLLYRTGEDHVALICCEEEPGGGQRDSGQLQQHSCHLKQPSVISYIICTVPFREYTYTMSIPIG